MQLIRDRVAYEHALTWDTALQQLLQHRVGPEGAKCTCMRREMPRCQGATVTTTISKHQQQHCTQVQ
jgi:hypothetical protein